MCDYMTLTYDIFITIPKYPLRKTHTFPLHHPLTNNSVHCADVETFHDFPFSVDTCHYLPNATN